MTLQFPQPTIVPTEDTILFLAQQFAEGENGRGLRYDIWIAGSYLECDITSAGDRVLRERIDIRPLLNAWVADLLTRAENGEAS
jgi:hypothetical protein